MPIRGRIEASTTDPGKLVQAIPSAEKDRNYAGFGEALAGCFAGLNAPVMPSTALPDVNGRRPSHMGKSSAGSPEGSPTQKVVNSSDSELGTSALRRAIERRYGGSVSANSNGIFAFHSAVSPSDQIGNGVPGRAGKGATPEQGFEARAVDITSGSAGTASGFHMPSSPGFLELQQGTDIADAARSGELAVRGADQTPPKTANSEPDGGGSLGDQTIWIAGGPQIAAGHQAALNISVGNSGRDTLAGERALNTEPLSSKSFSPHRPVVLAAIDQRAHPDSEPEPMSGAVEAQQPHRSLPKEALSTADPASAPNGPASSSRVAVGASPASGPETGDHHRFISPAETSSFALRGAIDRRDSNSVSTNTDGPSAFHPTVPSSGKIVNGEPLRAGKSATPEQAFEAEAVDIASGSARTASGFHMPSSPGFLELQRGRDVADAASSGELTVRGADQTPPKTANSVPDGGRSLGDQTIKAAGGPQIAADHQAALKINVGNSGRDTLPRERVLSTEPLSAISFSSHRPAVLAANGRRAHPGSEPEPMAGVRETQQPPRSLSSGNYNRIALRANSSTLEEGPQEHIGGQPTSKAASVMERELVLGIGAENSETHQTFGTDNYVSQLQQTDESAESVDPVGKPMVITGNEFGNISLLANPSEALPGTAAKNYDNETAHEQPIFHNLTIHQRAVAVAPVEQSQSVPSNVLRIGSSEIEAYKDGIASYTREIIIRQSGEVKPLTRGESQSVYALGRQPQDQTPSSSNADESQGWGSAVMPRVQLSGSETEQLFQTGGVSKTYFPKEAQGNRPHGEPETYSHHSTASSEQNSDESVRNEISPWPPTAHDGSLTRDMPVSQKGLTTRADESTRRLSNSRLENLHTGESSRTSNMNPNNATEHFHRSDTPGETSKSVLIRGILREPDLPKFEKTASLKVELQTGGSVRASIRERSGAVEVRMMTNDSQAAGKLTGEVDGLRTSLGTSGLKLQSFQVSYQNGQRQRPPNEQAKEDSRSRPKSADESQIFTVARSDQ